MLSTLRWFRDEYEAHIFERRCPAGVCTELLSYRIDAAKCNGCGRCLRECPADAIAGAPRQPHYIVQEQVHRLRHLPRRLQASTPCSSAEETTMPTIEVNGTDDRRPPGRDPAGGAAPGRHPGAHPVPLRGSAPDRRLPPVRGGGGGPARPGAELLVPGQRRDEGADPLARAVRARKTIVELLLANHPDDCLYCVRHGNCEPAGPGRGAGRALAPAAGHASRHLRRDISSPAIVRDPAKCILCGAACGSARRCRGSAAIDFIGRGSGARVGTAFGEGLNVSSCVNCGQCIMVCPTGALTEQLAPGAGRGRPARSALTVGGAARAGGLGQPGRGVRPEAGPGRGRRR